MDQLISIIKLASARSVWRGLGYHEQGHVKQLAIHGSAPDALMEGNAEEPYQIHVNIEHAKQSTCTRPFVHGSHKMCKHMVATVFSAIPGQVEAFRREVEHADRAYEEAERNRLAALWREVRSLNKAELQQRYFDALLEIDDLRHTRW